MRGLLTTSLVAAAALAPRPLAAQAADDDFELSERALGVSAPTGTWDLDDRVGTAEVPWDDYDRDRSYAPRGGLHFGIEARVGVVPTQSLSTSARPHFEVHGFVDIRYAHRSPWRLRLGVAVGAEPPRTTNLGGGTHVTSSAFSIRLRILPLSVDLGRNFGLRAGGDIGLQVAAGPDAAAALVDGAGIAQLVGRTDDGRVELGAYFGARMTGLNRVERAPIDSPAQTGGPSFVVDALLGLDVGYLF